MRKSPLFLLGHFRKPRNYYNSFFTYIKGRYSIGKIRPFHSYYIFEKEETKLSRMKYQQRIILEELRKLTGLVGKLERKKMSTFFE
jgi:hypothetical protein